jgi:serine/threonine-protein kinase
VTDKPNTRTIVEGAVRIGTELNQTYMVDSLIGVGGMGEVFRGHNIQTGDPVAIKIVLPEFARDEMILELFRKEARILNHLAHDAIVRYYVFSIDRTLGRPYLAMEFVDGPSLAERIRSGPLTEDEVASLQVRLADGLQKAHEAGVIHRDMSPDNVILPGGVVQSAKIIDFGIARSAGVGGATLLGGSFAGKYNYVSPEQLGLFGGEVTPQSDIYSLALVLAAALRGSPIDMSGTQVEVIEKRRGVPDLTDVSPRFRTLLEHMLQPDPQARPHSMAEVRDWKPPAPAAPIQPQDATVIKRPRRGADKAVAIEPEHPAPEPQPPEPLLSRAPPETPRSSPGLVAAAIALVSVIALGALGGWYYVQLNYPGEQADLLTAPPVPKASVDETPLPPAEQPVEHPPESRQAEEPEPPQPAEPAIQPKQTETQTAVVAPTVEPQPNIPEQALPAPSEFDLPGFLRNYNAGSCFHAVAMPLASKPTLAAFANDGAAIEALRAALEKESGASAVIETHLVADPQCPAIESAAKLSSPGAPPLSIVIDASGADSGQARMTVAASVLAAGNRSVNVLLVTDDGGVQNINRMCARCLSFEGDELKVRLPLERPATGGVGANDRDQHPVLLVALASPRNLFSISSQNIYDAADAFPELVKEIAKTSDVSSAIAYFKF